MKRNCRDQRQKSGGQLPDSKRGRTETRTSEQEPSTSKRHTVIPTALIHPFPGNLLKATDIYKVFSRQREAESYLRGQPKNENLLMFAQEKDDSPGRRQYIVSTLERFLAEYGRVPFEERHFYEVIMPDRPCRLYFDLEFSKLANPTLNGEEMVQSLNQAICESIREEFGIQLSPDTAALDLEATTSAKFSRHLIYHFPDGQLMSDYESAAQFVHKHGQKWKRLPNMLVSNGNGAFIPFWDEGVYTRFRNFRLFQSSKPGKQNPLIPASSCKFYTRSKGRKKFDRFDIQIFHDALISGSPKTEASKLLLVKLPAVDEAGDKENLSPTFRARVDNVREGHAASPYPEIDQMLIGWLSKRKPNTFIRSWKVFDAVAPPQSSERSTLPLIIYEIGNNRYCRNIEREHKSNNVMWLVDMEKGYFYQKCHDQECKAIDYRSNNFPIPTSVLALYSEKVASVPPIVMPPAHSKSAVQTIDRKDPPSDQELEKPVPKPTTTSQPASSKRKSEIPIVPSLTDKNTEICGTKPENLVQQPEFTDQTKGKSSPEIVLKREVEKTKVEPKIFEARDIANSADFDEIPETPPESIRTVVKTMPKRSREKSESPKRKENVKDTVKKQNLDSLDQPIIQDSESSCDDLLAALDDYELGCPSSTSPLPKRDNLERIDSPTNTERIPESVQINQRKMISKTSSVASTCSIPPSQLNRVPSPILDSQRFLRASLGPPETLPTMSDIEPTMSRSPPSTRKPSASKLSPIAETVVTPDYIQTSECGQDFMDDEELLSCGYMTQIPSSKGQAEPMAEPYDSDEEFMASLSGYSSQMPKEILDIPRISPEAVPQDPDATEDTMSQSELDLLGSALEEFEQSSSGPGPIPTNDGNITNDSDAEFCQIAEALVAEGLM